jgi:hypothetical protein
MNLGVEAAMLTNRYRNVMFDENIFYDGKN